MTWARRSGAVAALLLALVAVGALWIAATESGTRWLAARVADRLPDALALGTLHGSLLDGLRLESIEWNSEGLRLAANEVELAFELLPLARRQLNIDSLTVERLQLEISETTGSEAQSRGGPFSLPIDITLRSSSLRNITFARGDLQRAIDSIAVSGDFEGNALQLAGLAVRSDWLDLDLSGTGRITEHFPLDVTADWHWKEQDEMPLSGRLQASGDLTAYTVRHDLDAPLSVTTTGRVAYVDAVLDVDLLNEWASLRCGWPCRPV